MIFELWVQGLMALLSVALLLALVRLVRGPSLLDRVVAFDLAAVTVVALIACDSVLIQNSGILDIATVLALVGFLATAAFAGTILRIWGGPK